MMITNNWNEKQYVEYVAAVAIYLLEFFAFDSRMLLYIDTKMISWVQRFSLHKAPTFIKVIR